MKVSDIFFRLMEAATEQGIEQCRGYYFQDSNGNDCLYTLNPVSACALGLGVWGALSLLISKEEHTSLGAALPERTARLNDEEGWTFPDFYEYLKDKEAVAEKEVEPVAVPV